MQSAVFLIGVLQSGKVLFCNSPVKETFYNSKEGIMKKDKLAEKKKLLLEWFKSDSYKPMRKKEIAAVLQVPKEERDELERVLEALLRSGDVVLDTKGRYHLEQNEIVIGTFSGTGRGFGFVTIEGQDEDIYIPEGDTLGALNKDVVKVIILAEQTGRRREGKIAAILEHLYSERQAYLLPEYKYPHPVLLS